MFTSTEDFSAIYETNHLEIKSELQAIKRQLDQIARLLRDSVDEDLGWLKLAESSFAFWDNGEDAIYDGL